MNSKNVIKKTIALVITCVCMVTSLGAVKTNAAVKVKAPSNVKISEGTYWKYCEKHAKELKKKGISYGEGYDITVSWDSVKGADGYRVIIYWDNEGISIEKSTVYVKKENKNRYEFTAKTTNKDDRMLAKSAKDFIYNGERETIHNKSLSFFIDGRGSCVEVKKVKVKSYKLVKGKPIYSKYKTVYPKR